ncbi:hypothetical protein C8R46DRAFT_1209890 [Mycena filopes]|nr:hypothetical protein C8R46DRAFT_1209890 [Mycena filopes]
MFTSFVYLAIVASAPLLSDAKPQYGVVAVTVTATVTQTRTILRCPTASTDSLNLAGLPIPTASPSGNIVADVLPSAFSVASAVVDPPVSTASSLVRDPLTLPSGVLSGGSDIIPTSTLSSALAAPTDATATALGFIDRVATQLSAATTAVSSLSATLAGVSNAVGTVLAQITNSIASLTATLIMDFTDSDDDFANSRRSQTPPVPLTTEFTMPASTWRTKSQRSSRRHIETTASTMPKGTDRTQLGDALRTMQIDFPNAISALKLQCPNASKRQILAAAATAADKAMSTCLLNL